MRHMQRSRMFLIYGMPCLKHHFTTHNSNRFHHYWVQLQRDKSQLGSKHHGQQKNHLVRVSVGVWCAAVWVLSPHSPAPRRFHGNIHHWGIRGTHHSCNRMGIRANAGFLSKDNCIGCLSFGLFVQTCLAWLMLACEGVWYFSRSRKSLGQPVDMCLVKNWCHFRHLSLLKSKVCSNCEFQ